MTATKQSVPVTLLSSDNIGDRIEFTQHDKVNPRTGAAPKTVSGSGTIEKILKVPHGDRALVTVDGVAHALDMHTRVSLARKSGRPPMVLPPSRNTFTPADYRVPEEGDEVDENAHYVSATPPAPRPEVPGTRIDTWVETLTGADLGHLVSFTYQNSSFEGVLESFNLDCIGDFSSITLDGQKFLLPGGKPLTLRVRLK